MTAIVVGNTLGLTNTSQTLPGAASGNASTGSSGERVYVNAETGNLVVQRKDEMLAGAGPDISTLRTYNSKGVADGDNNDNWRIGFYRQLGNLQGTANADGSSIDRTDADGTVLTYSWNGSGYVNGDGSGSNDTLSFNGSNAWTWTDGDSQLTETYDWDGSNGKLQRVADLDGNALALTYDANGRVYKVASASGEITWLDYTGDQLGQLRQQRADGSISSRVSYAYDTSNRLSRVTVDLTPDISTDSKTYVTDYTYAGSSRLLASMVQTDGTWLEFSYDGANRITGITRHIDDTRVESTTISYAPGGNSSTVTDAAGGQTVYGWNGAGRLASIGLPGSSQASYYSYNSNGDVGAITDSDGNVTTMEYDARGNLKLQRDALGHTITRTYDAANRMISETVYRVSDPDGAGTGQPSDPARTRYVYDDAGKGHLRFVISAAGRVTESKYNAAGQCISTIGYAGDFYAGDTSDSVTEATVATWTGTANRAASQRTDHAYDFRGLLTSSTRYASVDAAGVASGGATTNYSYGPDGSLLSTTPPVDSGAAATFYVYDGLGRPLSVRTGSQQTLYQFDDAGRTATQVSANGLRSISTYDRAGHLLSLRQCDAGNATLAQTTYSYDTGGLLRMTKEPTGVRNWFFYDVRGRLAATIDGDGSMVEYRYNSDGQLTRTISHAIAVSDANLALLTLDAQGNPSSSALALTAAQLAPPASADDRSGWNAFDADGQLVAQADALGSVTRLCYDGAGRLTARIQRATRLSGAALASLGDQPSGDALAVAADAANDRISRRFYDQDGLLEGELDAEGYLVETLNDGAGQAWQTVAYATPVDAAKIALITASTRVADLRPAADGLRDIRTTTLRDDSGQVVALIDGKGYLTETTYDSNESVLQTRRYAIGLSSTVLDGLKSSSSLNDLGRAASSSDQVTTLVYDAYGRVKSRINSQGTRTDYVYNEAGEVISVTEAANSSTDASSSSTGYDLFGHVTSTRDAAGIAAGKDSSTSAFDAAGRLISSTNAAGKKIRYYYNADGMQVAAINDLGEVIGTSWNPLGQKTAVTQYGTRIAQAQLGSLNGGLLDAGTKSLLDQLASSAFDSTTRYTYKADGSLATLTDPAGNLTVYEYNSFGEQISVTVSAAGGNAVTTTTYDRRGAQTGQTRDSGGLGLQSGTRYDAFGRITRTIDPTGVVTLFDYDRDGHLVRQVVDPVSIDQPNDNPGGLGLVTQFDYDSRGNLITTTDANNNVIRNFYDADNRLTYSVDAVGAVTRYDYDARGNVLRKTQYVKTIAANALPGTVQASFGYDHVTWNAYDADNHLVKTVDSAGAITEYSYDPNGKLAGTTTYAKAVDLALNKFPAQSSTSSSTRVAIKAADGNTVNTVAGNSLSMTNSEANAWWQVDLGSSQDISTIDLYNRGEGYGSQLGNFYVFVSDTDFTGRTFSTILSDSSVRQFYFAGNAPRRGHVVLTNDAGRQIRMRYNAFGEMVERGTADIPEQQPLQEYFNYDNGGRIWRSNAGDGVTKVMLYDLQGNFTADIRSASVDLSPSANPNADAAAIDAMTGTRRVESRFDARGRVLKQKLVNGAFVYQTWDRWGNRLSVTDARDANIKTEYTYNSNNQLTRQTDPLVSVLGTDLTLPSNYPTNPLPRVRPVEEYFYDYAGNLVAQRDARGNVNAKSWDAAGNLLAEYNADDGVVRHYYDAFNKEVTRVDARGNATLYVYDRLGRLTSQYRAAANTWRTASGTVDANATEDAPVVLYQDSSYGGLASYFGAGTWDNLPKEFSSLKVKAGWKVYMYDDDSGWDGGAQNVTYAANGRDSSGNYVALAKSSLPSDIDNDVKTIIVSRIDGAEAQVELASSATSVLSYTYDELGRRLSATDGSGTTRYTYDLAGNVTRVDKPSNASGVGVFTITTYDARGHKASETSNGAVRTLTWTNDYFGRVTSHTMLSGTVLGYTYNYAGQVTQEAGDANGRAVTRSYDAYGELTTIVDRITGTGNRTTTYTYDLAGNRTGEKTMGASGTVYQNETIGYDEMGRMISVTDIGNGVSLSYLYDLEGNRALQTTIVNGVTTKLYYAYDSMNRQVLVAGAANFDINNSANITSTTGRKLTYDFNGNRTSETAANVTDNYVYDALNRLVKVTRNGNTLRYIKYDAADRVLESFDRSEEGSTDAVHYTNIYDAAGRLVRQYHRSGSSINSSDVISTGTDQSCTYNTYDDAGDLIRSVDQLFGEHTFITTSITTYTTRSDSKVQGTIDATRSDNSGNSGKSTFSYDVNGYLGSVTDQDKSANTRSFVTNVDGQILQKSQNVTVSGTTTTNVLRNLVANGQVLGTYGVGAEGDAAPVVSKVKVKVVMHVVTQNDSGGGNTSEFDVTFNAGGVSYHTYQEDISDGEEISTMLSGIAWPPANNKLTITLTGKEVDPAAPDDPLVTGTLNITTSQWTTEGQAFQSGNFANGDATYYLKAYLYSDQADPNPSDVVRNFNVAYQVIDAAHPGSGPGSYTVHAGDTLRSIAQGAYGDSALWYLVADANGLSAGASLQAGTVLKLPSTAGTIHNNADTYRPYDPARIVGDTSPYMVPPSTNSNTCKTVSIIIAAVLAAVVITVLATMATVATLGALGVPAMSAAGVAISLIFAAAGGAVSSMASQGILIAGGVQHEMDWADVATSAAIGAATAGVAMAAGSAVRVAVEQGSKSLKAARSALEEAAIYRQLAVEVNELEQGSARAFKLYGRAESALKAASKPSIQEPALAFSAGEALQKEAGTFGKVPWMLKQSFGNFLISLAGDMAIAAVSEIVSQVIRRLMPDGGDNRSLRERFSDFDWNAVLLATLTPGSGASGAKIGAVKDAEKLALSKLAHEKAVKKEMALLEDASRELNGVRKGIVSVPDKTPSWTDRAVAAAKAAGASMKALTKTKVGAPLTAVATGALTGFAGGLAKSSIVQGLLMAAAQQDEFDTKGMLLFGAANAVGGGINKGLLKLGSQRVNDATEKTDTVTFDAWRVSSALLGSLAANFELNASSGVASNESIAGYADVQDKSITGAYMVGYFRVGGMAGSRS